jgi:hypothetical protein
MDNKKAFYEYAASLGIKINDAQRLMVLAKNPLSEIENAMERWHMARDNDDETLERINEILYNNGYLTFWNDKK